MTRVFSTRQVSAPDRFAYWREIVCDVFVQLDAEPIGAGEFLGSISTTDVGPITVSSVDARRHHVARSPRQIAKADREDFLVSVQVSGRGVATQDGREAGLTAGDFVLYDTTRPYDLHFNDTFKQIVLQMPRAALDDRCLGLDRLTGVCISGVTPMGRIVHDFVSALAVNAPQLDPESAHRLGETTVDLLAVAFANALGRDETPPPSAVRTLHLRRIKSYIESNPLRHYPLAPHDRGRHTSLSPLPPRALPVRGNEHHPLDTTTAPREVPHRADRPQTGAPINHGDRVRQRLSRYRPLQPPIQGPDRRLAQRLPKDLRWRTRHSRARGRCLTVVVINCGFSGASRTSMDVLPQGLRHVRITAYELGAK